MNFDLIRPCAKCPFRTDCQEGWLGRERAREIFEAITDRDATFTCHETTVCVDDGDEDGDDDGGRMVDGPKAQHCAGAMILLEKLDQPNQMMRIGERVGFYDRTKLDMDAPVFEDGDEFEEHHDDGRRRRRATRV